MPAAASGKVYRTLDERCDACEVLGGAEEPCLSKSLLRVYARDHGRPCPRVELDPSNEAVAGTLAFLINEELRPLALDFWHATFRGLRVEDQRIFMMRAARALQDSEVAKSRRDAIKRQMKPEP